MGAVKRLSRRVFRVRTVRGLSEAGGLALLVGAAWQVSDVAGMVAGGAALLFASRYGLG